MPDVRISKHELFRLISILAEELAAGIRYSPPSPPSAAWVDDKVSRLGFLTRQLLEPDPDEDLPTWPPPPPAAPQSKKK